MGLLTPLYALAALAIAAPILFHLIRRRPTGRIVFSSLMFLSSSPPRLTQRSRLDHWLLLLLRAAAIGMIALAFSRPYFRQQEMVQQVFPDRQIVLLIDTSASMQRPAVWQQALDQAESVLEDLSSQDSVALYTIDTQLKPVVPLQLDDTIGGSTPNSIDLVKRSLQEIQPTWFSTNLSSGLIGVAELLTQQSGSAGPSGVPASIVLISDVTVDSGIEGLQSYTWPDRISVDIRVVGSQLPGNTRATMLQEVSQETLASASAGTPAVSKVRVENDAHSDQQNFSLQWADASGQPLGPGTSIQVPSGQVRVVSMPPRPQQAIQILLDGDNWNSDNQIFVPDSKPTAQRILFVGNETKQAENSLSYFLSQAPLSNALFRRELENIPCESLLMHLAADDVVAVFIEPIQSLFDESLHSEEKLVGDLRTAASRGVNIAFVLTEQSTTFPKLPALLGRLVLPSEPMKDLSSLRIEEAKRSQHALLATIDYQSSVFSPLSDPKFNDFSKIRFWKYRILPEAIGGMESAATPSPNYNEETQPPKQSANPTSIFKNGPKVLARFDDQSPWMVQQSLGLGSVSILTSGWQTTDSTFALSSKFIPVISRLVEPAPESGKSGMVLNVGQNMEIDFPAPWTVTDHLGKPIKLQSNAVASSQATFERPGLYSIRGESQEKQVAVQIAASESRHLPLDAQTVAQYGLQLQKIVSVETKMQERRQLQIDELEQQQKIWKWMLVTGLVILLIETWLAGRATKNSLAVDHA